LEGDGERTAACAPGRGDLASSSRWGSGRQRATAHSSGEEHVPIVKPRWVPTRISSRRMCRAWAAAPRFLHRLTSGSPASLCPWILTSKRTCAKRHSAGRKCWRRRAMPPGVRVTVIRGSHGAVPFYKPACLPTRACQPRHPQPLPTAAYPR